MIKVGILGATGYTGRELINILLKHPQVRITYLSAKIDKPKHITEIFPEFRTRLDLICVSPNLKEILELTDIIFLALPHTVSMDFVPFLLERDKFIIDLSADYRLRNVKIYEKFYKVEHKDKENLKKAIYGLPEFYRNKIKNAKLIANPGCYPTVSILAVAPLLALDIVDPQDIIIDAKSGASGAGKKNVEELLFCEIDEDFRAYKPNIHQHIPEIEQELNKISSEKVKIVFVPHLLPLKRGILLTIYARKVNKSEDILSLYKRFYKNEPFIRVREDLPRLNDVVNTNYCDITIREEKDRIIVIAVIDNLLKGASGQAVQNMNIIFGFKETLGLL